MTIGVNEATKCGNREGHAYTLMGAFTMKDKQNKNYDIVIVRDPWGDSSYNRSWNMNDTRWTADMIAQVPFGLNPKKSQAETGEFFM